MTLNSVAETLNVWGHHFLRFAWPALWQSSLLIVAMFLFDLVARRKLRPSVRYALWLVVLVKLLLPPSFAFPTGAGWWLRVRKFAPAIQSTPAYTVTYGPSRAIVPLPNLSHTVLPPAQIRLSPAAWALLTTVGCGLALLTVMLWRWRRLQRDLQKSQPTPRWVAELVSWAQREVRYRRPVRILLMNASISPALWGLFRPVIVLPATLVERLEAGQLRAVLLHELFHLRNGDVWINCFQSLLQIVYWWHPLLWLANSRVRRIREEAVDDAVRLALGQDAETYPPTLLEVARLALARPLATLGLVGILESRHALRQRVDRLVNFPAPRKVGLSIISSFAVLAFAGVALPMGQAPPKNVKSERRDVPMIYYAFDQSFPDYFGSNGVEAVRHALAQNSDFSNLSQNDAKALGFDYYLGNVLMNSGSMELQGGTRYTSDSSEPPLDSRAPNFQAGLADSAGSNTAIFGEQGFEAIAGTGLGLRPLNQHGWVEYNMATGIATATNGAVLTYGDRILSADNITLNRQTGEVVAKGSVSLKTLGTYLPMGGRLSSNVTNLQLAQLQVPGTYPSARPQSAISGRRAILYKLNAIRLNNVVFDNLPLSEVVNYLSSESKKRDPEGKGINFLLMPYVGPGAPGTIDPATGQVVPSTADAGNINSVSIRLSRPLTDVRMVDVLDAITKVADKPIRYSIEDYAVSFRLAGNETPVPLFSRTIKVDPGAFAQGLESVIGVSVGNFQTGGQGGGGGQQNGNGVTVPRVQVTPNGGAGGQGGQGGVQGGGGGISGVTRPTAMISPQAVKQFFVNAGVDLTPPKSVFYNDRSGALMVHATQEDLDLIEKAVGGLAASSAPPQTAGQNEATPKAVSPAADQNKVPVLGDLPVLGKVFTKTVEVAATTSPISPAPSPVPATSLPQICIKVKFIEIPKGDTLYFLSMLRDLRLQNPGGGVAAGATFTSAEPSGSFAEVLTDKQFRDLLRAVEQRDGADVMSESGVVTLSGRQAQIQIVDIKTVVAKINPQTLVPPGVSDTNVFVTENVPVGPVLDVIPVVGDDGMTVSLDVTATVTEFVGYDKPEKDQEVQVYVEGKVKSMKPPLPRIRVRQMQHEVASVTDGQTVMLGNPKDVTIGYYKDDKKVEQPGTEKKDLLVFLTTTLIDRAGNPIHSQQK